MALARCLSAGFRHARPARPSHCGSQTPKREQEPGTVVALDQSTMGALGRYGGASAGNALDKPSFRPPSLVDTNTFGCRAPQVRGVTDGNTTARRLAREIPLSGVGSRSGTGRTEAIRRGVGEASTSASIVHAPPDLLLSFRCRQCQQWRPPTHVTPIWVVAPCRRRARNGKRRSTIGVSNTRAGPAAVCGNDEAHSARRLRRAKLPA